MERKSAVSSQQSAVSSQEIERWIGILKMKERGKGLKN
jgi:hypothetical protein